MWLLTWCFNVVWAENKTQCNQIGGIQRPEKTTKPKQNKIKRLYFIIMDRLIVQNDYPIWLEAMLQVAKKVLKVNNKIDANRILWEVANIRFFVENRELGILSC